MVKLDYGLEANLNHLTFWGKLMGPQTEYADFVHVLKYRLDGESFEEAMIRIASRIADGGEHRKRLLDILLDMRFLPAGRIQAAMGTNRKITPFNCYVMGTIRDSMEGIMDVAKEAALTMKMGGGVGYDFSTLRPEGDEIMSCPGSVSSGPLSFMSIYDTVCGTIASAGNRRGAQMGMLRVDHPDILSFIKAKQNGFDFTNFNFSVAVTDEFMQTLEADADFDLRFDGHRYKTVKARDLWNKIMESTWDWAEPGVVFIDRINEMNNLWYCENIAATNPCAEQPLPPYGACLLGSFNLVRYMFKRDCRWRFDWKRFAEDIRDVMRAMDNIIDMALYPLEKQKEEAHNKRRMGLGITGLANAAEVQGFFYGGLSFINFLEDVLVHLRDNVYIASVQLADEKGAFPLFEKERYLEGKFIRTLPQNVQGMIAEHGIRNSHLTSIAPTGTISITADNVSSGIEPVYAYRQYRTDRSFVRPLLLRDYGHREWGVIGKTAEQCSVDDHVGTLLTAVPFVDSSISKTCNIGPKVTFNEFKDIYLKVWRGGGKSCSTFRANGKRGRVLAPESGQACYHDADTGQRRCE